MKAEVFQDGILLKDGSFQGFSKTLQPEEAQDLAWQLLEAAHSVHNEKKYSSSPDQTLEEYLESHPPKGEFKPCAFYNMDGNQLEVFWDNAPDFGEPRNGMCLHRSEEDGRVVGVTIYGIQKIMSIEEDDPNPDF